MRLRAGRVRRAGFGQKDRESIGLAAFLIGAGNMQSLCAEMNWHVLVIKPKVPAPIRSKTMTKDKERDDALIAENLLKARIDRAVELAGDGADIYGQMSQFNRLVKEGWQPKPDRAEVLAQALWDQWTLKASEVIDAQSLINDAFNELRAEWEAERPAVVVPFGDDVIAAARSYADVPVAESRIVIMANAILDGAKGGE